MKYIIAVDIGTTTIRSVLYDEKCQNIGHYEEKVEIIVSKDESGSVLVEIDPNRLFEQFIRVIAEMNKLVPDDSKVSLSLTTQRNSIVVWNKETKKEVSRVICWNDGRANSACHQMNKSFLLKLLNAGGAVLHFFTRHPRFLSARRLAFLGAMVTHRLTVTIQQSEEIKNLYAHGHLGFGCLDTWLLMRMSEENPLVVEASNVSSTGVFDPWISDYNNLILRLVGFPADLLVPIVGSSFVNQNAKLDKKFVGREIPISAVIADQQAAMFGCGAWKKGDVKISLGTGSFVDVHTGSEPHASMTGLYPLVGWRLNDMNTFIAEGNAHDTATILNWAQSFGLFENVQDTSAIALSVPDSHGAVFIPAFTGLQTPINNEKACTGFLGLRPDTRKEHMVRALLESIAFRIYQIFDAARNEVNTSRDSAIRICGGVSHNDFLCQCIADLLNQPVERMDEAGLVTAKGAAMIAGFANDMWTFEQMKKLVSVSKEFTPCQKSREQLLSTYRVWLKAVDRCLDFYD